MNIVVSPKLLRLFLHVLQVRYWVAGIYLVLALAGIYGASRIPTDTAIERLVVAGDPVAQATLEFERVFPEGEHCIGTAELRQAALLGRIIDGGEASLRPRGGRDGRLRELIDEGLRVPGSSRISGSAENQGCHRRHQ